MYKQCDDCKGVFKIPRQLEKYLEKNPKKVVYCPYCNGVWSHVYSREYDHEIVTSRRGKIYG